MEPSQKPGLGIGRLCAAAAAMVWCSLSCLGQGTFQITFDGPPSQPPGTSYTIQNYYESGMRFWSPTGDGFTRVGADWTTRPNNGTAYLAGALPFSLTVNTIDGSLFGVSSVELAGYSIGVPDVTAYFLGHRPDGSTVSTNFPASGLVFQRYYFGPEFNDLTRIEVLDFGSLDNLVVQVPEPHTWTLLFVGGGVAACRFFRRKV